MARPAPRSRRADRARALGVFVARGKKIPSVLLFFVASLPLLVAILGASYGLSRTVGALSGESIDPSMTTRIMAMGLAETMVCDAFGGLVATGTAIVACVAAASAVATLDARSIAKQPAATFVTGVL